MLDRFTGNSDRKAGLVASVPLKRAGRPEEIAAAIVFAASAKASFIIGYFVEREVSSTASLIVFLFLFFSNFAVSWIAVILAMDGSLKDAQGHQAQLDIEKSGRAGIALREANAVAGRAARGS
jgi:hypothetical protein